jgi:hypothetical protein
MLAWVAILVPAYWLHLGGWFIAGAFALLMVIASLYILIDTPNPQWACYSVFASSVIYFLPMSLQEHAIMRLTSFCVLASLLYWTCWLFIARHGAPNI